MKKFRPWGACAGGVGGSLASAHVNQKQGGTLNFPQIFFSYFLCSEVPK